MKDILIQCLVYTLIAFAIIRVISLVFRGARRFFIFFFPSPSGESWSSKESNKSDDHDSDDGDYWNDGNYY